MSKTTSIGAILSVVVATNIDYGKLIGGDHQEIGKLIGALLIGALGYYSADLPKTTQASRPPESDAK